jgi:hypothetical protein
MIGGSQKDTLFANRPERAGSARSIMTIVAPEPEAKALGVSETLPRSRHLGMPFSGDDKTAVRFPKALCAQALKP